jgi:uncharacterized protein
MNGVQHFDMPADDVERAKKFYSETFGWKIDKVPEMPYWMAYTCEVDEKFMCTEPNTINGGFYKREEKSSPTPVVVITVKDIDASLEKIKENGGEIFHEKVQVGDMGLYAQFKDPEGNIMGVWESPKK